MTVNNYIGLDVGDKRVGVAVATHGLRLARPVSTLEPNTELWERLRSIIAEYDIQAVVVGLPRSLEGQDTEQTKKIQKFCKTAEEELQLPVFQQDEALTSVRAKEIINQSKQKYTKEDIDALAASLILSDHMEGKA